MSRVRSLPWPVGLAGLLLLCGLAVSLASRPTGPGVVVLLAAGVAATVGALWAGSVGARTADPGATAAAVRRPRPSAQVGALACGGAMVGGLALALAAPGRTVLALEVVAAGAASGALLLAPACGRVIRRMLPMMLAVAAIAAVVVALSRLGVGAQLGPGGLWLPVVVLGIGIGGVLTLAVALGGGRSAVPARASAWELITGRERRGRGSAWLATAGALMVLWALGLGIALVESHVAQHPALTALVAVGVVLGAVIVIATPLAVTTFVRRQRMAAERTREDERQRIAAHLHDSVLQTLALVQRQADDPMAITRLARRQERSLRAWMAGEADLSPDTLRAALEEMIEEIEDSFQLTVELSMVSDRASDPRDHALVAATGEALRNVARHARGSPATVLADIVDGRVEVYVSDEGPGFVPDRVPEDRRGIRDSIRRRMAAVGGTAEITSAPEQGTEVLLRLPAS